MRDSRIRSWTKSFVWRIIGMLILGVLTFSVTGSAAEASIITLVFHAIRVILYYFHERLWEMIQWGRSSKNESLVPFYVSFITLVVCFTVLVLEIIF